MSKYIETGIQNDIATLWLNRPDKRNAFHEAMITEMITALDELKREKNLKAFVLRGKGKVFSAGADLDWMQSVKEYSFKENKLESKQLFRLFSNIYSFPLPVVVFVHGVSAGVANGLVAAADISLAEENTNFRFSEVQLGLLPATISPFVIRRIGKFNARELMMTGKSFRADKAQNIGLINAAGSFEEMENQLNEILSSFRSAALGSLKNTKWLIRKVSSMPDIMELEDETADMIASARLSPEGQEGMEAFAEKRKPDWSKLSNNPN